MSNKRSTGRELGEPVAPTVALQHAVLAVRRAWAGGVPDFAEWGSANVDPEPLIINDLNGDRLFYDFNVRLDERTIGVVRASANKVVGSPVVSLQLGPHRWSVNDATLGASKVLKQREARADVNDISLVCYCYPKVAIRVEAASREAGPLSMLVDVADLKPVERFGADDEEGLSAYSFLDEVAVPEADQRRSRWEAAEGDLEASLEAAPTAVEQEGAKVDLADLKDKLAPKPYLEFIKFYSWKTVRYAPRCNAPEVFRLYAQQTNVYCAVATGQMILDFYKYHFDQPAIAAAMGTGPGGTSNTGQVNGYESLSNNGLDATYDNTAAWSEAKAEIDANRPLKSGIPGHARACAGWKRQNITLIGQPPKRWLKIYDPWPWNADICNGGAVYWEAWDSVTHTNFIYVRHS